MAYPVDYRSEDETRWQRSRAADSCGGGYVAVDWIYRGSRGSFESTARCRRSRTPGQRAHGWRRGCLARYPRRTRRSRRRAPRSLPPARVRGRLPCDAPPERRTNLPGRRRDLFRNLVRKAESRAPRGRPAFLEPPRRAPPPAHSPCPQRKPESPRGARIPILPARVGRAAAARHRRPALQRRESSTSRVHLTPWLIAPLARGACR
jgi:hypothetical protein